MAEAKAKFGTLGGDYNGWENFETWCVWLWISSDQATIDLMTGRARVAQQLASSDVRVRRGIWTAEEYMRYTVADFATRWAEAKVEAEVKEHSMCADLASGAIEQVNWDEVARGILEWLGKEGA